MVILVVSTWLLGSAAAVGAIFIILPQSIPILQPLNQINVSGQSAQIFNLNKFAYHFAIVLAGIQRR
jgi:uncharacterized protein with PQ loop repeat